MLTLTTERLQAAFGTRPLRFYQQTGSTNDVAREWLRAGAVNGALVIADEQVKGRGRQGHGWHTPPGAALAVTVILHPPADILPRLTMLGALAIAELAEGLGVQGVGIKWPNDVQVNGLKISGVLVEAAWSGDQLGGAVLGMGLNVRVDFRGTQLADRATSLETALGKLLDRTALVTTLLERVDDWYAKLDSAAFYQAWQQRLVTLGQPVRIGDVAGVAEAVDADGALLVRDDVGDLRRVVAGEIG